MLRRGEFAFRRVLPIIAIAITCATMLMGSFETRERQAACETRTAQLELENSRLKPGSAVWDPSCGWTDIPRQPTVSEIVLYAVIAPGMAFSLLLLPLTVTGLESEGVFADLLRQLAPWLWMLLSAITWYYIGLLIDSIRVGDDEPPVAPWLRYYVRILSVLSPIWLIIGVFVLLTDRHGAFRGSNLFILASWLIWASAGTFALVRRKKYAK